MDGRGMLIHSGPNPLTCASLEIPPSALPCMYDVGNTLDPSSCLVLPQPLSHVLLATPRPRSEHPEPLGMCDGFKESFL